MSDFSSANACQSPGHAVQASVAVLREDNPRHIRLYCCSCQLIKHIGRQQVGKTAELDLSGIAVETFLAERFRTEDILQWKLSWKTVANRDFPWRPEIFFQGKGHYC